jgi:excisionase family DNA binding protein
MQTNELYTITEVCARLKIHRHTLREEINKGKLKFSKVGEHKRFSEEQIQEYLKKN